MALKKFSGLILIVFLLISSTVYGKDAIQLTMESAIDLGLKQNQSIIDAQRNLDDAKQSLIEAEADPTTLILALTQAQNNLLYNQVQFNYVKLQVTQTVRSNYLSVLEAQNQLTLAKKQLEIANENLKATKVKRSLGNATDADVTQAENNVASAQNSVTLAESNLKPATDKLLLSMGMEPSAQVILAEPTFKEVKIDIENLKKQAQNNLPTVIQARNGYNLAKLQYDLANNEYTPQSQIRSAQLSLASAQDSLKQVIDNLDTTIDSAYNNVVNTLNQIKVQEKNLDIARKNLDTDTARLKVGTITKLQLMSTESSLISAENNYKSAVYNYLKALDSLSLAVGAPVF
ncbi:MAG TPA: TolC family protein [bacterium]|nr:TolC family protein [bacterium]